MINQQPLLKWLEPIFNAPLGDLIDKKSIVLIEEGNSVILQYPFPVGSIKGEILESLKNYLSEQVGPESNNAVSFDVVHKVKAHQVQQHLKPLLGIKNIIAVASGKGGVGKSTTAVNLSLALASEGANVGLLDADIYGPSIPTMLGLKNQKPDMTDDKKFIPLEKYSIKTNSIGFLIDEDQPVVWRGPMVTQMLDQLIMQTQWGELDYLIIDMPPGTGDTQLTLSQRVPMAGAVIVTTPQDISLLDAKRGLQMFNKVNIKILGVVENMAAFVCPHCGEQSAIFGAEGGQQLATDYDAKLLGSIPLTASIRELTDVGKPSVIAEPDGPVASVYRELARTMLIKLSEAQRDYRSAFPNIVIENT